MMGYMYVCYVCVSMLQLVPYYVLNVLNFPGLPGIFLAVLFSGSMRYAVNSVIFLSCHQSAQSNFLHGRITVMTVKQFLKGKDIKNGLAALASIFCSCPYYHFCTVACIIVCVIGNEVMQEYLLKLLATRLFHDTLYGWQIRRNTCEVNAIFGQN